MTVLFDTQVTCAVCKEVNHFLAVASTHAYGAPDLDGRSPEMHRSTISIWVQRCHCCGYCAEDIGECTKTARAYLRSREYQEQLWDETSPALVTHFLCQAILLRVEGQYARSAASLVAAAWVCDDIPMPGLAFVCRKRAADMLQNAESHGQYIDQEEKQNDLFLLIDLLRRSGQFEQARQIIEARGHEVSCPDEQALLHFQQALIETRDSTCHRMSELPSDDDEEWGADYEDDPTDDGIWCEYHKVLKTIFKEMTTLPQGITYFDYEMQPRNKNAEDTLDQRQ